MDYANVRLTRDAAADVRTFARQLAAAADATVTQSDAIRAAVAYASDNLSEVAARVRRARTRTEGDPQ